MEVIGVTMLSNLKVGEHFQLSDDLSATYRNDRAIFRVLRNIEPYEIQVQDWYSFLKGITGGITGGFRTFSRSTLVLRLKLDKTILDEVASLY